MIRFIHTADIHFGVENYGKIDPQSGIHTRLLDFQKVLDYCIDYAINSQVDLFLFCGDAYKTTNPSPTQQRLLMRCFLRLQQAGIPLVIIVGNHDNPLSFGKASSLDIFEQLPLTGFYLVDKPQSFVITTKSGPVQIVGMPWPSRQIISLAYEHQKSSSQEITQYLSEGVAHIVQRFAQELNPELPAIFAGHLTVSSGIFSGSEKRAIYGNDPFLLPSQLALAPFDYVALGHLHRYQNLNKNAHPAIVYSGSLERIDFGERKEDKGFCVVTIHDKTSTQHQFIKTPTRSFIQVNVQLYDGSCQTEQIKKALLSHELTDAIVKIVYHVPTGHKDTVDSNAILKACSKAFHVASLNPIITPQVRSKRNTTMHGLDLPAVLHTYFSSKPVLAARVQHFVDTTLALAQEVESSAHNNQERIDE